MYERQWLSARMTTTDQAARDLLAKIQELLHTPSEPLVTLNKVRLSLYSDMATEQLERLRLTLFLHHPFEGHWRDELTDVEAEELMNRWCVEMPVMRLYHELRFPNDPHLEPSTRAHARSLTRPVYGAPPSRNDGP